MLDSAARFLAAPQRLPTEMWTLFDVPRKCGWQRRDCAWFLEIPGIFFFSFWTQCLNVQLIFFSLKQDAQILLRFLKAQHCCPVFFGALGMFKLRVKDIFPFVVHHLIHCHPLQTLQIPQSAFKGHILILFSDLYAVFIQSISAALTHYLPQNRHRSVFSPVFRATCSDWRGSALTLY